MNFQPFSNICLTSFPKKMPLGGCQSATIFYFSYVSLEFVLNFSMLLDLSFIFVIAPIIVTITYVISYSINC